MSSKKINWRWVHMIICAVVGVLLALFMVFTNGGTFKIPGGFAVSIIVDTIYWMFMANIFYWGFRMSKKSLKGLKSGWKKSARTNVNVYRDPGGDVHVSTEKGSFLYWMAFYLIAFFLAFIIGFFAFPLSIYKAIKKDESKV